MTKPSTSRRCSTASMVCCAHIDQHGIGGTFDRLIGYLHCHSGQLLASRELYWRNSMQEEFTCPKCSCQSIIYPDLPDDDDYVVCRTCGAFLGSVRQFRRFVERRPVRPGAAVTGC